jgi:hypothetical protein
MKGKLDPENFYQDVADFVDPKSEKMKKVRRYAYESDRKLYEVTQYPTGTAYRVEYVATPQLRMHREILAFFHIEPILPQKVLRVKHYLSFLADVNCQLSQDRAQEINRLKFGKKPAL